MSDAITSLIDGIMYAVKTLINKAEYDQTVSGHVLYYTGNNKYVVRVNGEDYTVKSNGLFRAFDSVEITKPKNKWLNAYISYPNTVNVTAEDLCDDAEMLRRESEEIRIANEIDRVKHEEIRRAYHTDFIAKAEAYDIAEETREASCSDAIRAVTDTKTSIESSYVSLQDNYTVLSNNVSAMVQNCDDVAERCETAAQVCEDIAAKGYVTKDVLADYAKLAALTDCVTKSMLQTELSDYTTTTTLENYVKSSALTTTLSSYATTKSLNDYVKTTTLTTTLANYVKTTTLDDYVTTTSLDETLADYVKTTALTSTLSSYAKTSALNSYVKSTTLTSTLSDYVKTSDMANYVPQIDLTGLCKLVQENGKVYLEVI